MAAAAADAPEAPEAPPAKESRKSRREAKKSESAQHAEPGVEPNGAPSDQPAQSANERLNAAVSAVRRSAIVEAGEPSRTAAGWKADPYRRHQLRHYDGSAWTDEVSDYGARSQDPRPGTSS